MKNRIILSLLISILLGGLSHSAEIKIRIDAEKLNADGSLGKCKILAPESTAISRGAARFIVNKGKVYLSMSDVVVVSWDEQMGPVLASAADESSEAVSDKRVSLLIGDRVLLEMELGLSDNGRLLAQNVVVLSLLKRDTQKISAGDVLFADLPRKISDIQGK